MIQVKPLLIKPDKGQKNKIGQPFNKNIIKQTNSNTKDIQKDEQVAQLITFAKRLLVNFKSQKLRYTLILRTGY